MIRARIVNRGHRVGRQWRCLYCWLDYWYQVRQAVSR